MQSLAGINVCTTVRMTVVKLKSGGLWVHAPIAPTRQGLWRMCIIVFVLQGLLPRLLILRWSTARLWCDAAVMSWLTGQCMALSRFYDMLACLNHPVRTTAASLCMCRECIELLEALGAPVEHIVLTTHAYEHKIFVPPFQRRYGTAQVWVVPRCARLSGVARYEVKELDTQLWSACKWHMECFSSSLSVTGCRS